MSKLYNAVQSSPKLILADAFSLSISNPAHGSWREGVAKFMPQYLHLHGNGGRLGPLLLTLKQTFSHIDAGVSADL